MRKEEKASWLQRLPFRPENGADCRELPPQLRQRLFVQSGAAVEGEFFKPVQPGEAWSALQAGAVLQVEPLERRGGWQPGWQPELAKMKPRVAKSAASSPSPSMPPENLFSLPDDL